MLKEEKNYASEIPVKDGTRLDGASGILRSWTALEVLTPQSYRVPPRDQIASLTSARLPWEGDGEKQVPGQRLYYEIVLGTVDLEKAVSALLDTYADKRIERPVVKGKGRLATIMVDRAGIPAGQLPVAVSSFGWGVPRALQGDLLSLSEWTDAEGDLVELVSGTIVRADEDENKLPVDRSGLLAAFSALVAALGLPSEWVSPPTFAIRVVDYSKTSDPPESSLLNSFFLNDLAAVRELFREEKATSNLHTYLGLKKPLRRFDLQNDQGRLEASVSPELFPAARWPGAGRHSLVLLQQAAVNLALSELKEEGILAVNGPPGTGKTTLLRDILAAIVTQRAEAMCGFDNPADAFEATGEKLQAGQTAWLEFFRLSDKLKGFEILIASSNNKAVENVSAELPALGAIAKDATDLRYFEPLATELLQKESWGLVAAVLGNGKNRSKFRQTFWWDREIGLSTYLAEACGTPQLISIKDERTGKLTEERPPRIVTECHPPAGPGEALRRWLEARNEFRESLSQSEKALAGLAEIRKALVELSARASDEHAALSDWETERDLLAAVRMRSRAAGQALAAAGTEFRLAEEAKKNHQKQKPGFFARLLRLRVFTDWKERDRRFSQDVQERLAVREQHDRTVSQTNKELTDAESRVKGKEERYQHCVRVHAEGRRIADKAKATWPAHVIDEEFFRRQHPEKQTTVPWCDEKVQRLRDDVFAAAMKLHKAFIDASAKPLRHNLGLLMQLFSGRVFPDRAKQALTGDLWSSFFLVVPSVSTTFASVERMLGKLPPESLGWLLVDEAGQALPQAAVGAIMRTKRAVVVGDPIQIEPVVTLPETLTQSICRHFGADPTRFNAPEASVQTIADAATAYFAEFEGKQGSRSVGVPLLVHRRCAEPMFGVSNAIAYENLMVPAKHPGKSEIRDCLGPSTWIDVRGNPQEKWCPEEGHAILELLEKLKRAKISPNLYIVTPFVVVQDNLRRLIQESGILKDWEEDPYTWTTERVGTVHTVQGREAEAVFFVLGAPSADQAGARGWAGGRPNLLNVAVTRAKEAIYVIGNRELWRSAGLFRELSDRLP